MSFLAAGHSVNTLFAKDNYSIFPHYVDCCILGMDSCKRSISFTNKQCLSLVLLPWDVIGSVVCLGAGSSQGYAHIAVLVNIKVNWASPNQKRLRRS